MNSLLNGTTFEIDTDLKMIEEQLSDVALEQIKGADLSGPELLAAKEFTLLEIIEGYERRATLKTTLLKARCLKRIRDGGLWSVMPGNYTSMEEAVQDRSQLSLVQQSNILALHEIIFPKLRERGISVERLWTELSPSNMTEIIPHLRMLLSGEPSKSKGVCSEVKKILEDEGDVDAAVDYVIDAAKGTNIAMRQQLNHFRVEQMVGYVVERAGRTFVLIEVDHDQKSLLGRLMRGRLEFQSIDLEQYRAGQVPIIRAITGGL